MNQFHYDAITKIICSGAPALADELCQSFANLVNERNSLKSELDEIKKQNKEKEEK